MLSEKQVLEIREHLDNAKNPVFFFDNDADGLCSFLILQRFIGRGRGVSLKGLPSLNKAFFKKAEEFNADAVFVLDRPGVDEDVLELNRKEKNLPIICIDHHKSEKIPENIFFYNTFTTSGESEPTSYLCYKITQRKEDLWLAAMGCIGDWIIPDFFNKFEEKYPELIDAKYKTAGDILYKTRLGKIIMVLNLALKDTTSNVVSLYKYLMNASNPAEILEENPKTRAFLERYEYLDKSVKKIVAKAEANIDSKNKILFFTYSGEMSLSQDISNELIYRHPELRIVVGFLKGGRAKFSLRGKNVRTIMTKAIKNIEGALGGGHESSCGAQMSEDKIIEFKNNFVSESEKLSES